jgi:N-acetylglucosaminyl-diphospho-decaprenol L-rhamnosyltransferase
MISAVIVNYKTSRFLPDLVASLRREGVEEICVCDSFSGPGERDAVRGLKGIHPLLLEDNPGYGAALNRGAREVRGDILLLMNADVELTPGSLAPLTEALARFDAVGPVFHWNRDPSILLPHPYRHSWKNELLQITLPETHRRKYLAHQRSFWEGDAPQASDLLCGAAFMVRREVFERLGGFDEGFFLYFEENDLFHRLMDDGGRAAVVPHARFSHFHSPVRTPDSDWFYRASKDYYEKKYFPPAYLQLRSTFTAPAWHAPSPSPLPDSPIRREDVDLLFSPFPTFVPSAMIRAEGDLLDLRKWADRLPGMEGFLGLARGLDIVQSFKIEVK